MSLKFNVKKAIYCYKSRGPSFGAYVFLYNLVVIFLFQTDVTSTKVPPTSPRVTTTIANTNGIRTHGQNFAVAYTEGSS
jgi:hypothetical protein